MKVFVVCCVLSIIKAEISDYSGLPCVPESINQSLFFTGNETELQLQCKPHKKYLTWLFQGSPIAVVNHCDNDYLNPQYMPILDYEAEPQRPMLPAISYFNLTGGDD